MESSKKSGKKSNLILNEEFPPFKNSLWGARDTSKYWRDYWKKTAEYLCEIGEIHINKSLNKEDVINIFMKGASEAQKLFVSEVQSYINKCNLLFEDNLRLNRQINELGELLLKFHNEKKSK